MSFYAFLVEFSLPRSCFPWIDINITNQIYFNVSLVTKVDDCVIDDLNEIIYITRARGRYIHTKYISLTLLIFQSQNYYFYIWSTTRWIFKLKYTQNIFMIYKQPIASGGCLNIKQVLSPSIVVFHTKLKVDRPNITHDIFTSATLNFKMATWKWVGRPVPYHSCGVNQV